MAALHRVRREDRFMYGPMKNKERQSLEDSKNKSQSGGALRDSELWWHLKLAKCMMKKHATIEPCVSAKVKRIRIYKKLDALDRVTNHNKTEAIANKKENINSKMSQDIRKVETIYDKRDIENKHSDILETKDITTKLNSSSFKDIKLLDVVINNMTSFPIFNMEKKLPLIADKVEILSISARDDPMTLHYPSVTKILAATLSAESKKALELWKARLTTEMGVDKFNEFYQEQLKSGSAFHSYIENTLYGRSVDVSDHIRPAFDSLSDIVKELEDIRAIESHIAHKHLYYKGKIDCIAMYRGELCVIDWKKSEKDKSSLTSTYDAPVQIAAYIGALNYSNSYPFTVKCGLIVVGYTNGKPADTYIIKDNVLKTYWKKWLLKLQQYWSSISKQT
ncbi:hypothetical protein KPH14_009874 [Odynerus spinipes]|uniref:Mitochondrial genome maintenance exonuclease 1 n=1 Tax=Odynerus spinipes TaxID=1348599 RepID=A0AAD9RWG7_9HYME|nr:hypothetical protein KPH14_009874 [Odynerus spinipes]